MRPFGEDRTRRGREVAAGRRGRRGGRKEGRRDGKRWSGERIGRVGDSRRVAGDVGEEEEILRLAARGYWKEARRDERRS